MCFVKHTEISNAGLVAQNFCLALILQNLNHRRNYADAVELFFPLKISAYLATPFLSCLSAFVLT